MFNEGPIQALWVLVEAQSVSMNLHPRPFPLSFGANDTSSQMKVMYFRVVERDPPPYLSIRYPAMDQNVDLSNYQS
ncbi:hypothetical protein TWF225_010580 [Orbilia oligospora]|nr:hypothetical protein TWF225_010580 [Orbilia oligospora]KAF3250981.1 hypothetical protein TWF128_007406 [Orbilia oligospora]KAF3259089.1 hypothetical protein TWF217_005236 [Orbilia oligospora]